MITMLLAWLHGRAAATPARAPAACGAEEPCSCCGWFDSSHELQHGLIVIEKPAADELGAWELSLGSGGPCGVEFA